MTLAKSHSFLGPWFPNLYSGDNPIPKVPSSSDMIWICSMPIGMLVIRHWKMRKASFDMDAMEYGVQLVAS